MKKHCFAFSLIACAVSVTFPNQAFAVNLYGAGSLRGALSEIAVALKKKQAFMKQHVVNVGNK